MVVGRPRVEVDRLLDQGHGALRIAALCRRHPQQVQRIGVLGLAREDLPIQRHGLFELSGLVMLEGLFKFSHGFKTRFLLLEPPQVTGNRQSVTSSDGQLIIFK